MIPLPDQAVKMINEIVNTGPYSPWLFPVRKFKGIPKTPHMQPPKTMLSRIFKETSSGTVSPHSLRRTFATQIEELGFADRPLVGRILNHTPQDVTSKHYLGGTGMDQIREALQRWADFLDRLKAGLEDKVVDIKQLRSRAV